MPAGLFGSIWSSEAVAAELSDEAWVRAMLDVEAALARAGAAAGVVPEDAAEVIAATCRRLADEGGIDPAAVGVEARGQGNPVVPFVRLLTAAVPGDAARHVHRGSTSQDVLDTAVALVVRRATRPLLADLAGLAEACAALAEEHRDTLIAARTIMQQALPTTFGAKAAGWMAAADDAADRLAAAVERLPATVAGAAGTLASLGDAGPAVAAAVAADLGLPESLVPWHTHRAPLVQVGAALGIAAGLAGKTTLDVVLMAQTEVGEVAEGAAGGSSTLPHKRNPSASAAVQAAVRRATPLVGVLLAGMLAEHERAAGAWQAEWETLRDLLDLTGGAVARTREVLEGLQVDAARMRANLDVTGGLLLAESAATALTDRLGRLAAHDLVKKASAEAVRSGRPLGDVLADDEAVVEALGPAGIAEALDPARYVGATGLFIDRALAAHRARQTEEHS
jgi:3-carboxy-cis,cis-muconate cycloisomerase